jgi:WD40 repeat protein
MTNFTHNLAIVIGINQYQNGIAELNTAKPDAEELANLLRDEYQYQVELITDDTPRKPTLKDLENLLTKWLPEKLQPPAENNRLLFYFAGHGMPLESDDGPRGFLLPQDADPKDSKTFLPMQVLHDALVALPCHHLLVILDCCFAGTFRWASTRKMIPIPETIHREHYDRFIRYRAWQVITSAAHNQEALDFLSDKRGIGAKSQHQAIQHSPFAEALFEALQHGDPDEKGRRYKKADLTKDGVITAPELYLYLRDNVETRSDERQTPGLYPLKKHDRGEYIFHDPNFDPQTLSKADPIDETNNPYRGLKPFEEEHARFFFGRQELIEKLYARIAAPDHSLTFVLGVSGSGKSSLVKAGLIPYLRELSKPPINDLYQWHILNPIRPGESPFAALARTIWAIADMPTTVQLDSLGFLSEKLNQKTEQLQTKVDEASWEHGETSRTTQRLKQEAKKFAQITSTWNQDTHAAKQRLIVEHFETIYALCKTQGEPESQQQQQLKQVFLACLNPLTQRLQSAPNSFIEIVKAWSQKHPGVKLLLVIDQFEELITLGRKAQSNPQSNTPEEWQQFLQLLETTLATNLPQLRIIVTLRSDFEPRFLNSEALKSYWTKARFPVRAMRSDELRQAIEGPASEMALYFEPANLVDRLIDEVGQMPGALPLLSFTLSEFYIKLANKWRDGESSDRALTIDASFDKEGGVAGSLTRTANEEYKKLGEKLGEAAQHTMRQVMLRMLTLEGGETARRRVPESELVYPTQEESDRVKQVVDCLVEARLLVKGQLETGEPYVEAAHDFLVRGWGTLQDWINEEKAKETLELQQRLTAQANDWDRNNRADGLLMPDGDRLKRLEETKNLPDHWLNQRETAFIQSSIDYRDSQRKQARELRARAELQKKADKIQDLLSVQPQTGLVLAIQAIGQNLEELQEILTPVQASLRSVMEVVRVPNIFHESEYDVRAIAFSSDGRMIVSGSSDGTICLWNIEGKLIGQAFQGHVSPVISVAFSPDSQYIVSCSADMTVSQWTLEGNLIGHLLQRHENPIQRAVFSSDCKYIVSCTDRMMYVWDLQGNLIGQPFQTQQGNINALAFSLDSQYIACCMDRIVQLLDLQGNPICQPFQANKISVTSVAFSPDSQHIISGGVDAMLQLWDLQGNPIGQPFLGGERYITSIAFSPDGQTIASGCADRTVYLWDTKGDLISKLFSEEPPSPLPCHTSVFVSSDSQYILSTANELDNKTVVRLCDIRSNLISKPFQGHQGSITSVAFSPDNHCIASGSVDATVRLWDTKGNQIGQPFRGHKDEITSIAFSSDSQYIVSGSRDGEVRLWDIKGNPVGQPFRGHQGSVISVTFGHNCQYVISCSADICISDMQGNPINQSFYMQSIGSPELITSVAFSRDGQYIAVGKALFRGSSDDRAVYLCLYDIRGRLISKPFQGHQDYITSVAFSPNGEYIVSSSYDKTVRLWDLKGKLVRQPFRGHKEPVISVAFSPNGEYVVSGSYDKTVRLWDLEGKLVGQPFQGHQDWVNSVTFSPDGHYIVSGSKDGKIRLWRGSWQLWLQVCCDRLHYHPVFKNPEAIEEPEQRQIAIAACETCRKYVWSKEDTSV